MIKKNFFTDATFTAFFILTIYIFAQINDSPDPVAVLDFEAHGVMETEAKTLTEKLRGELLKSGNFKVIERSRMEQILKEQGFQQTGCTSNDCAVEMGQLLGVKNIITGSIGKVGKTFLISARIIDVSTGEISKIVDENAETKIDKLLTSGMKNVALKLSGEDNQKTIDYEEGIPAKDSEVTLAALTDVPSAKRGRQKRSTQAKIKKNLPLLKIADIAFNNRKYAKAEVLYRRYLSSKGPKRNQCHALYRLTILGKILKHPREMKIAASKLAETCPKSAYTKKVKKLLKKKL